MVRDLNAFKRVLNSIHHFLYSGQTFEALRVVIDARSAFADQPELLMGYQDEPCEHSLDDRIGPDPFENEILEEYFQADERLQPLYLTHGRRPSVPAIEEGAKQAYAEMFELWTEHPGNEMHSDWDVLEQMDDALWEKRYKLQEDYDRMLSEDAKRRDIEGQEQMTEHQDEQDSDFEGEYDDERPESDPYETEEFFAEMIEYDDVEDWKTPHLKDKEMDEG